ncbi:hypothetical protein DV735_g663, partial [Chaetothyriales sp. CBS 134920]
MSTFASVVRKPGQKITPRAAPRRNIQLVAEERQSHAGTKRSAIEDDQGADDQADELPSIEDEVVAPAVTNANKRRRVSASVSGESHSATATVVAVTTATAATSEIQDLLQRSRTSASAVSELSLSIDRDTDRRLRSRSRQQSSTLPEAAGDQDDGGESRSATRMDSLAAAVLDRPSGPRGRRLYRRGHTPEDAENFEIDADNVQMGDLTKDSGLGKRSETGKRLEAEWAEIKERWEDHAANNRQAALNKRAKESEQQKQAAELGAEPVAPMMTIVNNQIVFVEGAREVSFHDNHEQRAEEGAQAAKVDEPIYRYVNQNRIGKKAGRLGGKVVRWDDDSTDLFYKGLRMFGTDFEMIANLLFPGKTRKEIKDKFVREERKNHARVIENTRQREVVDLDELIRASEIGELKDPEQVLREMQAEEEKLRRQYEEKRAHQNGEVLGDLDEADQALPSIENDGTGEGLDEEDDEEDDNPANRRMQNLASSVLGTRQKQQRKSRQVRKGAKDAAGRAKANKKGKKPLEGVEERIGTIDEVAA